MKPDWNFWDWITGNDNENKGNIFRNLKRIIVAIIVFFLIPFLLYFFVNIDPVIVIGQYDDGEPRYLGIFVIFVLYWGGAYFLSERDNTKRRLKCLLDKLLSQDEEEFNNLLEIVKMRRKDIKQDIIGLNKGEERVRWFDID